MDRMDTMFESDPVISHLYQDSFRRKRLLEPEKELMLAILTDAIECLHKHSGARQPGAAKLFQEAREWIFNEDDRGTFSFLNVCEALELDPCYIRRGIANLQSGASSESRGKKAGKASAPRAGARRGKQRGKWPLEHGRGRSLRA